MSRPTLKRGASRKAVALAGVLALALLSPASALANAGGADRPINGAGTGTISLDPATGAFTGVVPGVSSHLGDITVHIAGAGAPAADGTFAGSGTATLVAANGDQVTGTITLTQTALPDGHTTTTVVVTITGGHRTVRGRERNVDGDLPVGPALPRRGAAPHRRGLHVHRAHHVLARSGATRQRPRRSGPLSCPLPDEVVGPGGSIGRVPRRGDERVASPHESSAPSPDRRARSLTGPPPATTGSPRADVADPALHVVDWPVPPGRPRIGSLLLVHGFGEHLGRYADVAPTLTDLGLHVRGYDARGHGRSPGPRGVIRDPPALLDDLVRMFGRLASEAGRGRRSDSTLRARAQPGRHGRRASRDLRALIAPRGLILCAPAFALRLSPPRRLGVAVGRRLFPDRAVANGQPERAISHDSDAVARALADPLVHDRITLRLVRFAADTADEAILEAPRLTTPTLLLVAGADRHVDTTGSRTFFDALPAGTGTLRWYDELYHELLHEREPDRAEVLADLRGWLQGQLARAGTSAP